MRIFLTGATGFIGSALVPELIGAGHQVIGMARSDAGAHTLVEAGAEVHRGTLEDPDSVRDGAARTDGVIHTAFDHDFSRFAENCEKDRRVIAALGAALAGSDRPLVVTSGTGMGSGKHGEPATEDVFNLDHPNPRIASELAGNALLDAGINVSVMRLPQVHNPYRQGLITPLIAIAREKGVSAYVGDGRNRWPAAHVSDVARLYRLALEKRERGARYHAVAEEGVSSREIAGSLGRGLKLPVVSIAPEDAQAHFGWMSMFVGLDMPASSAQTRTRLNWNPDGPTLIADLDEARYVAS
jgi:nucleoside-diphosphate-sugar epimerase